MSRAALPQGFNLRVGTLLLFSVPFLACSKATVTRSPDGVAHLMCERGMKDCINQAERVCGDDGYVILSGKSQTVVLGPQTSAYRTASESAELKIRCGVPVEDASHVVQFKLPRRTDEQITPSDISTDTDLLCAPGATQRCLGPGACDGAQACAADGKSFGPCDCGAPQAAPKPEEKSSLTPDTAPVEPPAPAAGTEAEPLNAPAATQNTPGAPQ